MNQDEKIEKIIEVLKEKSFTIKQKEFSSRDILKCDKNQIQDLFDRKFLFCTNVIDYSFEFKYLSKEDLFQTILNVKINLDMCKNIIILTAVIEIENFFKVGKVETDNLFFKNWKISKGTAD
jgi:hypothetical protein